MKYKKIIAPLALILSMLVLIPGLSSFTSLRGGEGFEVFLNNKRIAQHFGKELTTAASLHLDPTTGKQELKVIYHHCGQNGKDRQLIIRDESNKMIYTAKFANANKPASPMTIQLNDLPAYTKSKGAIRWSLHYFSSELPKGRQLATLEKNSSLAVRK